MPSILCFTLLAALAAAPPQVRIVCLGDSVTRGERPGVAREETFCARLQQGLMTAGVQAEVINAGVGSNTTALALERFERDVLARKPTHVVIMFGLNDSWIDEGKTTGRLTPAAFGENLEAMIVSLKRRQITPILMTPNPVALPKYPPARNASMKPHVEVMRATARAEGVSLVDIYADFAELAIEGVDLNTLYTDAMHPNPRGHQRIADLLTGHFKAILRR